MGEDGTIETVGTLRVGEIVDATTTTTTDDDDDDDHNEHQKVFCVLQITQVEHRTFQSLDNDLAQMENFSNAIDLKQALRRFYKDLQDESILVVVYFQRF